MATPSAVRTPQDQPTRWLKLPIVEKRVGLKKTRIYELMGQGKFPLPIKPGGYTNLWSEAEIEFFLSNLMDNRENTFAGRR